MKDKEIATNISVRSTYSTNKLDSNVSSAHDIKVKTTILSMSYEKCLLLTGVLSGFFANIVAIPFSASYIKSATTAAFGSPPFSLTSVIRIHHGILSSIVTKPSQGFTGGTARSCQKVTTSLTNKVLSEYFTISEDLSQNEKMLWMMARAGVLGAIVSPVGNYFKILQSSKVNGYSYQSTIKYLATPGGFKRYRENTLPFMFGESLRCSVFFGANLFLRENMGIKNKPNLIDKLSICTTASLIAATIESIIAYPFETFAIIHSQQKRDSNSKTDRASFKTYANLFTSHHLHRSSKAAPLVSALIAKNFFANFTYTCIDETGNELANKYRTDKK